MRILLSSLMPPDKVGACDFLFLLSFSKLSSVRLTDVRTSEVISKYLYAQTISSRKREGSYWDVYPGVGKPPAYDSMLKIL